MMGYNLIKTMKQGKLERDEPAEAPALESDKDDRGKDPYRHKWLERKPVQFLILTVVAITIGGIIEFIPTFLIKSNVPTIASVQPYTPLELEGRDVYIAEGCNNCHSQMVRPFRSETERYGDYSKAGEFVYDRPHLWGSKRTGPDLHRLGRKYPDAWHYNHMMDPASMSPGSLMPPFPWLAENLVDVDVTPAKIRGLQKLGVPYPEGYDLQAVADLDVQASGIAVALGESGITVGHRSEMVALIAYLQRLGTDIKAEAQTPSGR